MAETEAQIKQYFYDKFVQSKANQLGYKAADLPSATKNEIIVNALNFFYIKLVNDFISDEKAYWQDWTSDLPENVADALAMSVAPTLDAQYDQNKFIPDSHGFARTYEQIYSTNFKRFSYVSTVAKVMRGAFGNPQSWAIYMQRLMKVLKDSINQSLFYNITNYAVFSDKKLTSDILIPTFISAQQQNATPKKIIKLSSTELDNEAFKEILKHVRLMCTPMQTNYNIGDPFDSDGKQTYNFGFAHNGVKMNDFIILLPSSQYNAYMTNVDPSKGTANIYNVGQVELNEFLNQVYEYDDVNQQIVVNKIDSTDGYAKLTKIANPFYGQKRFLVAQKQNGFLSQIRIDEIAQNTWARNLAGTYYNHYWFNFAANLTQQGIVFELTTTNNSSQSLPKKQNKPKPEPEAEPKRPVQPEDLK